MGSILSSQSNFGSSRPGCDIWVREAGFALKKHDSGSEEDNDDSVSQ